MHRTAVLKRTDCDLRKLPLGAREAFLLAQLDGRLTLEEVGEITGLAIEETSRIAARLVELGAASTLDARASAPRTTMRRDPRAEEEDEAPPPPKHSKRPADVQSVKPKGRSRKSLGAQIAAKLPPMTKIEPCELDPAVQAAILELDAKLPRLDHYAKLGVERGAEKKAVKRAYFAFVAKYHPDRFFGKKLGALGAPLDRVFQSLTEAHDTLVDAAGRAAYDARLPRMTAPAPKKTSRAIAAQSGSMAPRKSTKAAMRAASKKMEAVKAPSTKPPPSGKPSVKPPSGRPSVKPQSVKPSAPSKKPPSMKPTQDPDRLKRLVATAREIKGHARVEMFVKAAEEAFAAGDVIGAANNYRLALEHREDPYLRNKLDDVEVLAKAARFDKAMARARGAEKERKWVEAATQYARAFEAKPDATAAERAANAMLISSGDLERALELAERAVEMRNKVPENRITLAQILYTLEDFDRAEEEVEEALELAPKDSRAKDLAKLIAKKKKEKS